TEDVPVAPPVKAEREPDRRLRVESSPEMVTSPSRRRHRGGGWVQLGIVAGVVLAICGAAGYGIYWGMKNSKPPEYANDNTPAVLESEGNSASEPPPGWKPDDSLRRSLHVSGLAYSRKKPRNHFALRYQDYKVRTPSDAELLDDALRILRNPDSPFSV